MSFVKNSSKTINSGRRDVGPPSLMSKWCRHRLCPYWLNFIYFLNIICYFCSHLISSEKSIVTKIEKVDGEESLHKGDKKEHIR